MGAAEMTALSRAILENAIVSEIHAIQHLYDSKANDADFICATVAESMGRDLKTVRKVWDKRFHIGGAC